MLFKGRKIIKVVKAPTREPNKSLLILAYLFKVTLTVIKRKKSYIKFKRKSKSI